MKIKRFARLCALVFFVALASVLPVPLTIYRKDNLPKFNIEQIDKKEDDTEDETDIKELF